MLLLRQCLMLAVSWTGPRKRRWSPFTAGHVLLMTDSCAPVVLGSQRDCMLLRMVLVRSLGIGDGRRHQKLSRLLLDPTSAGHGATQLDFITSDICKERVRRPLSSSGPPESAARFARTTESRR